MKWIWAYFDPWKVGVLLGGLVLAGIGVGISALGVAWAEWLILLGFVPLVWFTIGGGWFGLVQLLNHPADWPERAQADDQSPGDDTAEDRR